MQRGRPRGRRDTRAVGRVRAVVRVRRHRPAHALLHDGRGGRHRRLRQLGPHAHVGAVDRHRDARLQPHGGARLARCRRLHLRGAAAHVAVGRGRRPDVRRRHGARLGLRQQGAGACGRRQPEGLRRAAGAGHHGVRHAARHHGGGPREHRRPGGAGAAGGAGPAVAGGGGHRRCARHARARARPAHRRRAGGLVDRARRRPQCGRAARRLRHRPGDRGGVVGVGAPRLRGRRIRTRWKKCSSPPTRAAWRR